MSLERRIEKLLRRAEERLKLSGDEVARLASQVITHYDKHGEWLDDVPEEVLRLAVQVRDSVWMMDETLGLEPGVVLSAPITD